VVHKDLLISVCVDSRVRKIIAYKNSSLNKTPLNSLLNNLKEVYLPPLYMKLDLIELSIMDKKRWIYVYEK